MMNVCYDAAVMMKVTPFVNLFEDATKNIHTDHVQVNLPFENALDSKDNRENTAKYAFRSKLALFLLFFIFIPNISKLKVFYFEHFLLSGNENRQVVEFYFSKRT